MVVKGSRCNINGKIFEYGLYYDKGSRVNKFSEKIIDAVQSTWEVSVW